MRSQPLKPDPLAGERASAGDVAASAERLADPPGHPSGLTIIASKVAPAVEGRMVLTRPRLVSWLDRQTDARVILLTAEAGYGKSTLLNDFARRTDLRCLWFRLESSDGDWITFLSYLVAALRDVLPEFGRPTEALLRTVASMGASREIVLSQFLVDLGAAGQLDLGLILDDYHLVSDSEDVRLIISRLIERAPSGIRFILAGRGRPNLSLGRLIAQGQVAELTTNDLRFTRPEIEELFATAYLRPLDQHACDVVAERTQGWAASLQLVAASIAVSKPSEVAPFIEALSGAEGPIYDFLAEEVLSRMAPLTVRVLLRASLIDRVTPALVTAALSTDDEPATESEVASCLEDVRTLGLLGQPEGESSGARIHPLFRQFLEHQLGRSASPQQIRAMHRAIAPVAETSAWLAGAKHWALAEEPAEAMRVLGSAASEALGTGAWGAAVEVVDLMPDAPPPPAVEVIKARALVSAGRPEEALAHLEKLDPAELDADELSLVGLARASALQLVGDSGLYWDEVEVLGSLPTSDGIVNRLSKAWALLRVACRGGSITAARRALEVLSEESTRARLTHFAGIALHNAATAALAQADYADAVKWSRKSMETLQDTPVDASVRHSTLATLAMAEAELGNVPLASTLLHDAVSASDAHPDVLADGIYLAALTGELQRAESLVSRLRRMTAGGVVPVGGHHHAAVGLVTKLLMQGRFGDARSASFEMDCGQFDEIDGVARSAFLRSVSSYLDGGRLSRAEIQDALATAESQQAWRWEYRLRILESAIAADGAALRRWVEDGARLSALSLLEMADVIAGGLHLMGDVPTAVTESVARFPGRWRPALLRQLMDASHPSSARAAELIANYGTQDDAIHLLAYERQAPALARRSRYSRMLVRRVTPTLRIHDLGRTTYEIGGVEVEASASRRKALEVLLYLVTRSRQTAPREQALEGLWPNQSPTSATNSLHQTLHFIRREIAPWSASGPPVNYVRLDSELIYLDQELVQVDSVAFMRQATDALNSRDIVSTGVSIIRLYRGRFAPEFEYEDWAQDWRTLVHAQFLRLCQATASALLKSDQSQAAIDVLSQAVELDPLAFEARRSLIYALYKAGATDAAADHYRQYAAAMQRELGVRAPPYDEVVRDKP